MLSILAQPLKVVHGVEFGMKRETVRAVLGGQVSSFKKSKFSKTAADDFGFCHVFYDETDACEAIEIFDDTQVIVDGAIVYPGAINDIATLFPTLVEQDGSYICREQSIGIYAPSGDIESILFGKEGYYGEA